MHDTVFTLITSEFILLADKRS